MPPGRAGRIGPTSERRDRRQALKQARRGPNRRRRGCATSGRASRPPNRCFTGARITPAADATVRRSARACFSRSRSGRPEPTGPPWRRSATGQLSPSATARRRRRRAAERLALDGIRRAGRTCGRMLLQFLHHDGDRALELRTATGHHALRRLSNLDVGRHSRVLDDPGVLGRPDSQGWARRSGPRLASRLRETSPGRGT